MVGSRIGRSQGAAGHGLPSLQKLDQFFMAKGTFGWDFAVWGSGQIQPTSKHTAHGPLGKCTQHNHRPNAMFRRPQTVGRCPGNGKLGRSGGGGEGEEEGDGARGTNLRGMMGQQQHNSGNIGLKMGREDGTKRVENDRKGSKLV